MAFDVRVQNVLKKNPGLTGHGVATGGKKTGLTDRGVATGVTKFRMASGGLTALIKHDRKFQKLKNIDF